MDRAGSSDFRRSAPGWATDWATDCGPGWAPGWGLALGLALMLGGCVASTNGATQPVALSGAVGAAAASDPAQRVIERDVEAPDVFHKRETGLWDGRPSLGGVWVAHPDAHDPERVLIRNTATGATVIGALFRRERENPGPKFQISSEAANALGILPGAPSEIDVTALRLQRVEMELPPAPETTTTAADETLDLTPVATPAEATHTADAATTPPASAADDQVAVNEAQPRGWSLADLFRPRPPATEPIATAPIATATLPAVDTATNATTAAAPSAPAAPAAPSAPAASDEPEHQGFNLFDLFRRRPAEPAPAPAPDTTPIALPGGAANGSGAQVTAPAESPVPAQPTAAPRIDRPYVQIGIFSVEQNAVNARAQMQRAGMSAEIRRGRVGDNLFWRVVVGPAQTVSERGSLLRRVRSLGFGDAYAVVR